MTESQRYFAKDILRLWESKNGRLSRKMEKEFLFHPMMDAIVTYRWLLIKLAIEKHGKRKFQDILEFLEINKDLSTAEIEKRLKNARKEAHNNAWALAA
jgi:hypothetical protein